MRTISASAAFNEETRVGLFLEKFNFDKQKLVDEVVIINDGSTDKTKEVAEKFAMTVLKHSKRQGLGSTLMTSIKYAIENNYDVIVFIAPNGKDNPNEIPKVLKPILEGKADYVQGSRYLEQSNINHNMPFLRKFATKLHPFLIRTITGFQATDSTNGFRAIKVSLLKDKRIDLYAQWLEGVSFEFYLYLMAIKLKYRLLEVPVTKIYPKTLHHFNYSRSGAMTKTRPIIDWWRILKPLLLYSLRLI